MEHSPELDKLATALAKAQSQVKGAAKDSTNPHFKSKYADLASVWDACRDALTVNGLSVVQMPGYEAREDGGVATLTTLLLHTSGQWIKGTAGAALEKNNAQGVGSALTYLRRYALAAVASVAPEDDDGNEASTPRTTAGSVSRHADIEGEVRLPGDASKWDGWGGKPLTEVPGDVLTKVGNWLAKKDPLKNKVIVAMIGEVLELRRESLDQRPKGFASADQEDEELDAALAGRVSDQPHGLKR